MNPTVSLMHGLGEIALAEATLRRFGRAQVADVVAEIATEITSELDLDVALEASLRVAAPMSSSDQQHLKTMRRRPPKPKTWLCCTKPVHQTTHGQTHRQAWMSVCRYKLLSGKLRGQVRAMKTVVSFGQAAPRAIKRGGKRMPSCPG